MTEAIHWFRRAAEEFGHLPSVTKMGFLSLNGMGERTCSGALKYLRPSAQHGSWANVVRRGFNRYLAKDYDASFVRYLEAGEMGYEVAMSNAAYLLDRSFVDVDRVSGYDSKRDIDAATAERMWALRLYLSAKREGNDEHDRRIGDFYYYGNGGVERDMKVAADYYRAASAAGDARGAYALATMYENGEARVSTEVKAMAMKNHGALSEVLARSYYRRTWI